MVEQPRSAAAGHLQEWLAGLAAAGAELALVHSPGALPELPSGVEPFSVGRPRPGWAALRYDQRLLPAAARQVGARLLLILGAAAPLRSWVPVAAVPPIGPGPRGAGASELLRRAVGLAGLRGVRLVLVASDLPQPAAGTASYPAFVSPAFHARAASRTAAEARWVLCYDTRPEDVRRALAAWTWVDGSLGDTYPLVFGGLEAASRPAVLKAAAEFNVQDSVLVEPPAQDPQDLYAQAGALLSVRPLAWGQPYRWALASGVPVAAFGSEAGNAILGAAGYLVADRDTRALGAACLSLLVQDELAESLRARGAQRAASFQSGPPLALLLEMAGGKS